MKNSNFYRKGQNSLDDNSDGEIKYNNGENILWEIKNRLKLNFKKNRNINEKKNFNKNLIENFDKKINIISINNLLTTEKKTEKVIELFICNRVPLLVAPKKKKRKIHKKIKESESMLVKKDFNSVSDFSFEYDLISSSDIKCPNCLQIVINTKNKSSNDIISLWKLKQEASKIKYGRKLHLYYLNKNINTYGPTNIYPNPSCLKEIIFNDTIIPLNSCFLNKNEKDRMRITLVPDLNDIYKAVKIDSFTKEKYSGPSSGQCGIDGKSGRTFDWPNSAAKKFPTGAYLWDKCTQLGHALRLNAKWPSDLQCGADADNGKTTCVCADRSARGSAGVWLTTCTGNEGKKHCSLQRTASNVVRDLKANPEVTNWYAGMWIDI